MAIYKTEQIKVNGSQFFLGGVVYSASYNKGYNGQPSTLEVSIIAQNGVYEEPVLGFKTPYSIVLGGNGVDIQPSYTLHFYAVKYCITDGQSGKILNVSFMDGTNLLRRKWVALKGTVCVNPNVILLGTIAPPSSANSSGDRILSYSYSEFQAATAFLGIPNIPSNEYTRLTDSGTVLDVFNHFMNLYGYAWHLEDGKIQLINVRIPTSVDEGVRILDTSTRILNKSICKDISNNYVRGVVAIDVDTGSPDSFILKIAPALWDGTDVSSPNFLGFSLATGYGARAALYALQGREAYFAYIWKSQGSIQTAIEAMGYKVYSNELLSNVSSILERQAAEPNPVVKRDKSQNFHLFVVSANQSDAQSSFDKDLILGEILLQGYYILRDINPSVNWLEGQPEFLKRDMRLSEISQFKGLIDDKRKISNIITDNVWLASYAQKIIIKFSEAFTEKLNNAYCKQLPFSVPTTFPGYDAKFAKGQYFLLQVDKTDETEVINNLPKINYSFPVIAGPGSGDTVPATNNYSFPATRGIVGDINPASDIRFSVPAYGMAGRKITACNIPNPTDTSSYLEVDTKENLLYTIIDPLTFIQQNVISRDQTDVQVSYEIRGISTGLTITPEMGLDTISIRLDGSDGYISTYNLSSKKAVLPNVETLIKPLQKVVIN